MFIFFLNFMDFITQSCVKLRETQLAWTPEPSVQPAQVIGGWLFTKQTTLSGSPKAERLGLLLIIRHLTDSWGPCWRCYHGFQKQRSVPRCQPHNERWNGGVFAERISSRLGLPRPGSGGRVVILQEMWHVCFCCWLIFANTPNVLSNVGWEAGL